MLDELVRSHIPLVRHVVRETRSRLPGHVNRDDLTSAGLTALVVAATAFDPGRGISFASYAGTRVRGAILDDLRSVDWASRSGRRRARELEGTRADLTVTLGRTPTDAEVTGALGISVGEVSRNAEDVHRAGLLSLQGFGETPVEELVTSTAPSPEAVAEKAEMTGHLVAAVAELSERLRAVVEGWFFAERPMAEIAAELGVTEPACLADAGGGTGAAQGGHRTRLRTGAGRRLPRRAWWHAAGRRTSLPSTHASTRGGCLGAR